MLLKLHSKTFEISVPALVITLYLMVTSQDILGVIKLENGTKAFQNQK